MNEENFFDKVKHGNLLLLNDGNIYLVENNFSWLSTWNVAAPLMRRYDIGIDLANFVDVQPMKEPVYKDFYLDYVCTPTDANAFLDNIPKLPLLVTVENAREKTIYLKRLDRINEPPSNIDTSYKITERNNMLIEKCSGNGRTIKKFKIMKILPIICKLKKL